MQAREYAKQSPDKHVGYIECLRNIRRDHASGEQIDFTDWEEAERLTSLQEEDLNLLLDMYKVFYTSNRVKLFKTVKRGGIPLGAKWSQESPGFSEEAEKVLSGEKNFIEASKDCGLPYMTFRGRMQTILKNRFDTENDETYRLILDVCQKWKRWECNKTQAAEMLGIKVPTFNKLLKVQGIERNEEPMNFVKAYEDWRSKKITKEEAAKLCGICKSNFEQLIRKRQKNDSMNNL